MDRAVSLVAPGECLDWGHRPRGDRVRFVLINDTMMEHPIHLHGLWSELDNGHGEFRPYKHTINVKPGERLSYLVTADEPEDGQQQFLYDRAITTYFDLQGGLRSDIDS